MSVIDKKMIAQSFGKAAQSYDSAAHFQQWVGHQLLGKMPVNPAQTILDLGCGTGYFFDSLKQHFPDSRYLGLDLSEQMLVHARTRCLAADALASDDCFLTGDAENLPLRDSSVDLIFSSLAIQWCFDLPRLMGEVNRVLRPGGSFVFSSLLEGTLKELKASWATVDCKQHVNSFFLKDSYQVAAIDAGLEIHRLETELHVLRYDKLTELMRELKAIGAHNLNADRASALTGRQKLARLTSAYEIYRERRGQLPASYEIIWGVLEKPACRI
jgi:malonyl-CoA O-methyltransferase